jgi:arylsulfatase A
MIRRLANASVDRASTVTLLVIVAAIALVSPAIIRAETPRRPNVVFILADDLGWADLGCYGSSYHRTPNLDKLAGASARFTQAYAAAPVCSPTRAAIMTGQFPVRLGITDWLPGRPDRTDQKLLRPQLAKEIPADVPTLPGILKAAGYATGHIGKWHLGGPGAGPQQRGFDINIAGDQSGSPISYFAPYAAKDGRTMPGLEKAPEGEYLTDRLTAEAEKFIEANKAKPFFLYLSHYAVHIPMKAKAALVAKYKAGPAGKQGNPIYAAMIESLDESVGRILKKLDDLKLSDSTIVIFTSDNGGLCVVEGPDTPPTINSPLREGKGYLYEGGLRVPLIIRMPANAKPAVIDTPVSSIDFLPTILEACSVKSNAQPDGVSLIPLTKAERLKPRDLYWHYPHYSNQGGKPGSAIRSGDYKLIEFYENGRRELFNLKKDPGESQNLIESDKAIASQLGEKLDSWRQSIHAGSTKPNPDYAPNPPDKDGNITLHSRTAEVHGVTLRYEPLPHKNTLGFWVRADDWASWEFTVAKPGVFTVEILQGCGKGQGGSEVELSVDKQVLKFVVEDTGHFQNFKPREIGTLTFENAGRYAMEVKPKKKAAAAVMDLRAVILRLQAR